MSHAPTDPIDVDDPVDPSPTPIDALALRSPSVPATLNDLAALRGEARAVVESRVQVLTTLRRAALGMTHPPDWVLFKSPDEHGGQIVGYLQDAGCDRVRDLLGIEVFEVSKPERIAGDAPGVFHYLITGAGRCKLTRQTIEGIEGGRGSTDDFAKGETGTQLELKIRKAARANLDGNITRELAGLNAVPIDELAAAWAGTSKRVEDCRKGRGFGSARERLGGRSERAPDVDAPVCVHCGKVGQYRPAKGDRRAFYGCPDWERHRDKRWIQDADEWVAKQQAKAAAPSTPPPVATTPPPTAADIFKREPGQEG